MSELEAMVRRLNEGDALVIARRDDEMYLRNLVADLHGALFLDRINIIVIAHDDDIERLRGYRGGVELGLGVLEGLGEAARAKLEERVRLLNERARARRERGEA